MAASYLKAISDYIVDSTTDEPPEGQRALADVLRYIKNYQGTLSRKDTITENYRFSDEREWRYVPPYQYDCRMIAPEVQYSADPVPIDASVESLRLEFQPNDIKYIIIRDDSEISDFVDLLRHAKGKNYSYRDVERLTTRLFTTEQILGDI